MGANKTIAKNTLFLYARMLLIMIVSLYTSRIILKTLGVSDYGIYNVVGGLVATLSFLTSSISSGTSRYFAYCIGQKDNNNLALYFRLSVTCFTGLGILCLVIAETLGLWFLNTQLNIASERLVAANWVYQFSVLSFIVHMFLVPNQSMIISQENMTVYAYVGIAEVIAKLLVVYLLVIGDLDKLILLTFLYFLVTIFNALFYIIYCRKKYDVCKYRLCFQWDKLKEFISYSVWIVFGTLSGVIRDQGINILLNMFFGVTINAARGIAYQVNRAVTQFLHNFYMAVRPQITKRYAGGENQSMFSLVFSSSRICFYLVLLLSVPIIIQAPLILSLWLHEVPEHTVAFTRLVLIVAIIDSIAYPLDTSITATGNIKGFQFYTGGFLMLNLPVSYVVLKMGGSAESTMVVMIVIAIIAHIIRMHFAKKHAHVPMRVYFSKVLLVIFAVSVIDVIPLVFLYGYFNSDSFFAFLLFTIVALIWTLVIVYVIGINKEERSMVKQFVMNKIKVTK